MLLPNIFFFLKPALLLCYCFTVCAFPMFPENEVAGFDAKDLFKQAIATDDAEKVKELIKIKPELIFHDIPISAALEFSPLRAALYWGSFDVAKKLVNYMVVNKINDKQLGQCLKYMDFALAPNCQWAQKNKLLELFCKMGADVNIHDGVEETPLQKCYKHRYSHLDANFGAAQILVNAGASIMKEIHYSMLPEKVLIDWIFEQFPDHAVKLSYMALENALKGKNYSELRAILSHCSAPITKAIRGCKHLPVGLVFTLASQQQDFESRCKLRMLLKAGLNPDIHDTNGKTLMHYAVAHQDKILINLLCEYGADISIEDSHGFSPFHYATNRPVVLEILLNAAIKNMR